MQQRSKNSFLPRLKSNTGILGESIAVSYLLSHSFRILERNFKAHYGEIDIVAQDKDTLVFVEVKTRCNDIYGSPESAITQKKLHDVIRTGYLYVQHHPEAPKALRVDVIAIVLNSVDGSVRSLRHIQNVTSS